MLNFLLELFGHSPPFISYLFCFSISALLSFRIWKRAKGGHTYEYMRVYFLLFKSSKGHRKSENHSISYLQFYFILSSEFNAYQSVTSVTIFDVRMSVPQCPTRTLHSKSFRKNLSPKLSKQPLCAADNITFICCRYAVNLIKLLISY